MPTKISKITLVGFRGATAPVSIEFDSSKPVTLIFGENGTGKSTIADAFDFVCNRSFGSLENYSLGEPAKKHVASLGHKATDVSVTLVAGSNTWRASLGKDGPLVTPPSDCPTARILRRRTILRLIETQPKQRFEELKAFIALPNIERCETSLRDVVKTTNNYVNELARAIEQANEELTKLWIAEGEPDISPMIWANAEAQKDLSQLWANLKLVENLLQGYQEVEASLAALDAAIIEQRAARLEFATVQNRQQEAELRSRQHNADLRDLLQEAVDYITGRNTLSQCPVCEQNIDSSMLARRLEKRIGEMQGLVSVAAASAAAQQQINSVEVIASRAKQDFIQKASRLAKSIKTCPLAEITAQTLDWERYAVPLDSAQLSVMPEEQAREFWHAVSVCRMP